MLIRRVDVRWEDIALFSGLVSHPEKLLHRESILVQLRMGHTVNGEEVDHLAEEHSDAVRTEGDVSWYEMQHPKSGYSVSWTFEGGVVVAERNRNNKPGLWTVQFEGQSDSSAFYPFLRAFSSYKDDRTEIIVF